MRALIYLIVILNTVLGFYLLFRERNPFKGKNYRDMAGRGRKSK